MVNFRHDNLKIQLIGCIYVIEFSKNMKSALVFGDLYSKILVGLINRIQQILFERNGQYSWNIYENEE